MQATLDWATIRSPIDGMVIDKKVDVGDMVTPGQMLLTLFDPKRMQLVASVRESLARRLQVGQKMGVRVEGSNKQCSGTVSEIVPEAQAASRSFQVKVTGPCPAGIYTGMFGRIVVPLEDEEVLVIPPGPCGGSANWNWSTWSRTAARRTRAVRTGRSLARATWRCSPACAGRAGRGARRAAARRRRRTVVETFTISGPCGRRARQSSEHDFTNRIVKIFLESNLSIILILLAAVIGLAALGLTPREEDPQIVVPAGRRLRQLSRPLGGRGRAACRHAAGEDPLPDRRRGIRLFDEPREPGVITVRYYVGEDRERSLVKLTRSSTRTSTSCRPASAAGSSSRWRSTTCRS